MLRLIIIAVIFFVNTAFANNSDILQLKSVIKNDKNNNCEFALSALSKIKDKSINKLAKFIIYKDIDDCHDFMDIAKFIDQNQNFPSLNILQAKAEAALCNNSSINNNIASWLAKKSIQTNKAIGKLYLHQFEKSKNKEHLIKAWEEGDFSTKDEIYILDNYSQLLNNENHQKKINRLIWQDKLSLANRVIKYASPAFQKLYKARIALRQKDKNALNLVKMVTPSLQNNTGLLFDLASFYHKNDSQMTEDILLRNNSEDHAKEWWKLRNYYAREALNNQEYELTYNLVKNHNLTSGANYADAEWLAGWVALRFLNKPQNAIKHFTNLSKNVKYAVSKSRAYYWLARALEENNQKEEANKQYKLAANYTSTFYGQLAYEKLFPKQKIKLHLSNYNKDDIIKINQNELVKLGKILLQIDENNLAKIFLSQAIKQANSSGEMLLIIQIPAKMNKTGLQVTLAKEAAMYGAIFQESYPKHGKNTLVNAIIRQESNFDVNAKSSAGALGLMQLMPATAKKTAQDIGEKYHINMLTRNPDYNVKLGQTYIHKQLEKYENDYILAIGAYNAGPHNTDKWLVQNGDHRNFNKLDDIIDWMELVPYAETRNYIQRVIENMMVYEILYNKSYMSLKEKLL
jgi:soluble lytic murein transglycosylase